MLTRRHFLLLLGSLPAACRAAVREPDFTVTIGREPAYEPAALAVPVGSTVAWHHMAESVHTVTADPAKAQMPDRIQLPEGAQPFDSGDLHPGEHWVHTFEVAGTYVYFCRYHEMDEMLGVITVTG